MTRIKPVLCLFSVLLVILLAAGCAGQSPSGTENVSVASSDSGELPPSEQTAAIEQSIETEPLVEETKTTVSWMSYSMDIEITEEEPPGTNQTPNGKYVHVTMTYLSDEDGYGGFLFEDIKGTEFTLEDSSGNVYEHLQMYSPLAINFVAGEGFTTEEIQKQCGIFFDIPVHIPTSDLTLHIAAAADPGESSLHSAEPEPIDEWISGISWDGNALHLTAQKEVTISGISVLAGEKEFEADIISNSSGDMGLLNGAIAWPGSSLSLQRNPVIIFEGTSATCEIDTGGDVPEKAVFYFSNGEIFEKSL